MTFPGISDQSVLSNYSDFNSWGSCDLSVECSLITMVGVLINKVAVEEQDLICETLNFRINLIYQQEDTQSQAAQEQETVHLWSKRKESQEESPFYYHHHHEMAPRWVI